MRQSTAKQSTNEPAPGSGRSHLDRFRSARRTRAERTAAALVVSPAEFWQASGIAIVCPITTRVRPFGTSVVLPDGLAIAGEVLTSHVRSIDTTVRGIAVAGRAPDSVLADVRAKLAALIGL